MKTNNGTNSPIIWLIVGFIVIGLVYYFYTNQNKPVERNLMEDNPEEYQYSGQTPPSGSSDQDIDMQLKDLNNDASNLEKSLNDTPIDVNQ